MLTSYEHIMIKDFVWTSPFCNKLLRFAGPSLKLRSMSSAKNAKIAWGNLKNLINATILNHLCHLLKLGLFFQKTIKMLPSNVIKITHVYNP